MSGLCCCSEFHFYDQPFVVLSDPPSHPQVMLDPQPPVTRQVVEYLQTLPVWADLRDRSDVDVARNFGP